MAKSIPTRAECAVPAARTEDIRVRVEGLTPDYSEDGVFVLAGVALGDVNYAAIAEALAHDGVDLELAERATEQMAEYIYAQTLAAVLAKRMTRVG